MKHQFVKRATVFAALAVCGMAAQAADWSDTSIGYGYGTKFQEPFNGTDISKSIVNLTHASGYKYGTNFLNVDMLMSDKNDPSSNDLSSEGAHETYVVYRHTLDLGKVMATEYKFGPVRGLGITAGFDYNNKNDVGYNSKKRMLVAGPTLMLDVPGFLNISLLALWESNQPSGQAFNASPNGQITGFGTYALPRYSYDVHPMISASWGIPIGSLPLSFEGFANIIASKGTDEYGFKTGAETLIDARLMYDASSIVGAKSNTFKFGVQYQYWRNKFGNTEATAGSGSLAKTPMVRAEYHF